MNDEARNEERREEVRREDDQAAGIALEALRTQVAELEAAVAERDEEISTLEEEKDALTEEVLRLSQAAEAAPAAAPAGDDELRGLAATIRACHRNGHPDAQVHLDNLLRLLGA